MKILKVNPKKYYLNDRVPPSEYLDVDRMAELKYTLKDKVEIFIYRLIYRIKKRFKK